MKLQKDISSSFESVREVNFGTAYKALTIVKLKQINIPLPPLSVQQ